jgi:hypothetical protein
MEKFKAILNLFRKGHIVTNPDAWKKGQINVAILTALLSAIVVLSKAFGYEIPVTEDQLLIIAGIILSINSLFNPIATTISSEKVGFGLPVGSGTEGTTSGSGEFPTERTEEQKPVEQPKSPLTNW